MQDAIVVTENTNISNTVKYIKALTLRASENPEIKKIAQEALKSNNVLKYVFDSSYEKVLYVPNEGDKQQLRTIDNLLRTKKGNCTGYSELIGAVLLNLGIPFSYRVVSYPKKDKLGNLLPNYQYEHIYIVTNDGTILDPVLGHKQDGTDTRSNRPGNGKFNFELPYYKKIDYPMTKLEILQGTLHNNGLGFVSLSRSKMSRHGLLGCSCNSPLGKTWFGKALQNVANVVRATHVAPVNSSFKSITGNDLVAPDKVYTTKAGMTTAKIWGGGADIIHGFGKNFANSASAGMATKATNSWRAEDNKEGDGTALVNLNKNISKQGRKEIDLINQEYEKTLRDIEAQNLLNAANNVPLIDYPQSPTTQAGFSNNTILSILFVVGLGAVAYGLKPKK